MKGDLKTADFTKLNAFQRVPVLVLDDGTAIAETIAICRYFEATKPAPALFGTGPLQSATIEMWNRRMELNLLLPVSQAFRHLHPAMAHLEVPQVSAWGEANKPRALEVLSILDRRAGRPALHRRRRLLGRRHNGSGCRRLHEAGTYSEAGRLAEPRPLVCGSFEPAQRQGVAIVGHVSRAASRAEVKMKITVVGCGDAFGSGGRLQTCYHVEAGERRFLIDCGATAIIGLNRLGSRSERHRHDLHLPPARRSFCGPGLVDAARPACGPAHRAADDHRARGHRGAFRCRRRGVVSALDADGPALRLELRRVSAATAGRCRPASK